MGMVAGPLLEGELRLRLARHLGQQTVSHLHWNLLVDRGHVQEALELGSAGERDLVEAARALSHYVDLMEGVAPSQEQSEEPREKRPRDYGALDIGDYEVERVAALGEYLSLRGMLHPQVRRFREEALGGRLLTRDESRSFIVSPVNSRFPSDYLRSQGVPAVGHTAWFVEHGVAPAEGNDDWFVEYEYVYVDPPGDTLVAALPPYCAYDDLKKARFPRGGPSANAEPYTRVPRGNEHTIIPIYPDSVLDRLAALSLKLSETFCAAWDETECAWFVLTGETISPKALNGRYDTATSEHLTYGTITLEVQPWVSANTVAKFYRHLQRDVLLRKVRSSESRNLAVFRFVIVETKRLLSGATELNTAKPRTPWPELMERWNAANSSRPSWTYRYPSRFRRDYHRAGRAVVEPYDDYEVDPLYMLSVP